MKTLRSLLPALLLSILLVGCGSGSKSQGGNGQNGTATSIHGNWSIVNTESGQTASTLQVTLVSSSCSVSTPVGTFTVQGPNCFIADDNTGEGSISGTGNFIYPPQGVLIGIPASPVPANQTASIDLLFVEADQFGDAAVFNGNGTVTNGAMTGTFDCNANSPVCSGISGSFSGTKQ
jgi:hypothetical protein